MKKSIITVAILGSMLSLQSCYINTTVVGKGGTTESARGKSIYILGNRISEVDTKALAGGASDYTVDSRFNFVDYLVNGLTGGILGLRTVIVKK